MVEVRLVGMYAGVVIGVAGESFGGFFVGKFARLYTRATGPETAETRPPQPFWGKPWSHTHLQFMLT